jgi:hypothetical protein
MSDFEPRRKAAKQGRWKEVIILSRDGRMTSVLETKWFRNQQDLDFVATFPRPRPLISAAMNKGYLINIADHGNFRGHGNIFMLSLIFYGAVRVSIDIPYVNRKVATAFALEKMNKGFEEMRDDLKEVGVVLPKITECYEKREREYWKSSSPSITYHLAVDPPEKLGFNLVDLIIRVTDDELESMRVYQDIRDSTPQPDKQFLARVR